MEFQVELDAGLKEVWCWGSFLFTPRLFVCPELRLLNSDSPFSESGNSRRGDPAEVRGPQVWAGVGGSGYGEGRFAPLPQYPVATSSRLAEIETAVVEY